MNAGSEAPDAALPHAGRDGSRELALFIFNTDVRLYLYGDAADELDAALIACRDRCLFFERALSRTRPDSDISRAHAASPAPVAVEPETAELCRLGIEYGARSEGRFDITMGTITSLWDFHAGVVPSRLALARALPHVGAGRIRLGEDASGRPTIAIEDPKTILDLGGIAKGHIADDLARLLRARGIGRFVLNLGGNVLVGGGRPEELGGGAWRIGIVNPRDPSHHRAIVDIADGSVVTSGLHERRFTRGGVTYHHILDPATGMPAKTDLVSATIVSRRSIDGDGYSTAALMMGADAARSFFEGVDGVETVLITDRDEVIWTDGLSDALSFIPTLPEL
ncbi:MAG: FAD:protein FMN transferase [Coriobacteriaceae bacterium]|nr:FAD:protein FMN transferase [Coriobacteriaceae bacterium]